MFTPTRISLQEIDAILGPRRAISGIYCPKAHMTYRLQSQGSPPHLWCDVCEAEVTRAGQYATA